MTTDKACPVCGCPSYGGHVDDHTDNRLGFWVRLVQNDLSTREFGVAFILSCLAGFALAAALHQATS